MKSDKCLLAKSNLPGVNKARSEDSCLLFEDGAALVDGVSASDCESGSLMSKATVLNLGRTWLERQDVGELMAITDKVVSGIENAASIRKGGAAACIVRQMEDGSIEIANVGDTNAALVRRADAEFLFSPMRDGSGRIYNYIGSSRCSPESVERYNFVPAMGDLYVVLLSDGAWESLPLSFIRSACLESNGRPIRAATTLTAEARRRGSLDDASAIVLKIC